VRTESSRSIHFLACGINFAPEEVGTGKYNSEMCQWLAARGHEVRAIVPPPWFPDWKDRPEGTRTGREMWNGVAVRRVPIYVPRRPSGLRRLLQTASFALSSFPALIGAARHRTDVVWVSAPSMGAAPGALLAAAISGAVSWIHIQDFEVDTAFELGLLRGKLPRRIALGVERRLLRGFDVVSTISERMVARLIEKGVDPSKVVLLPNWVDLESIRPDLSGASYRAELGIADNVAVALYAGSMGCKQGLELLAAAANGMRDDPSVHFVFCGEGVGRAALERASAGLPNVSWLPLQPRERLGSLLAFADMHLLPQRAGAADLVMPSKLGGMLASGRPVIATALPGTAVGDTVARAGLITPPGNAEAFCDAIRRLARSPEFRTAIGQVGRELAQAQLNMGSILGAFEFEMEERLSQQGMLRGLRGTLA
jgi:colanic acid biosynthesis glycosyl transferase WcaI